MANNQVDGRTVLRETEERLPASAEESSKPLNLYAEELSVDKEQLETGRLHVTKKTVTQDAAIDADLIHEDAIIETVPRGHRIFVMPVTRVEGDTTIVPIVEEVLFTEKRLVLKEEIRITRRTSVEHFHDTVTLRRQEAVVSRIQSATEEPGAESGENLKKPKNLEKPQE